VVGATAGAVGIGVIAAALASGLPVQQRVTPTDHLRTEVSTAGTSPSTAVATMQPRGAGGSTGTAYGVEAAFSTSWAGRRTSWFATGPYDSGSTVPAVTTTVLRHLVSTGR
jgi:hypothetical protein